MLVRLARTLGRPHGLPKLLRASSHPARMEVVTDMTLKTYGRGQPDHCVVFRKGGNRELHVASVAGDDDEGRSGHNCCDLPQDGLCGLCHELRAEPKRRLAGRLQRNAKPLSTL